MEAAVTREQIEQRIVDALVEFGADRDAITPEATWDEIDVDSLDLVELGQIIEDDFGVVMREDDFSALPTVGKTIDFVAERA